MIIRSKDKVQMGGKNKPVWMLDTDALTVTHTITDAESSVTKFSSDHIKYHLHYSAEYRPARLKKLVNDGTILSYLIDLDRSIAEAIERQVGMMLENDTEYLRAVAVGDLAKARGLENMDRLIARDPVYAAMVYVDEYIRRMKSYAGAKKLTREMALELIEYIKVDAHPGHRNLPRTIHVFYKLIDKPLTNKRNALE